MMRRTPSSSSTTSTNKKNEPGNRMKITASVINDTARDGSPVWKFPLPAGGNVLDRALGILQQVPILEEICIFSNDPELNDSEKYQGVIVQPFDQRLAYNFNFLDNLKLHNECFTLQKTGSLGDIHLFLDIHYPLLKAASLLRMFHTLMENRFASKVIPVYSIDPHLYLEIPESGQYINLWGQQGLDRQHHPPLFRTVGCCFVHCGRLKEMQPLTFPFEISKLEGYRLSSEQDLDFIGYVNGRQNQP